MAETRPSTGIGTKRCPRCGEVLFEDMDVCYGCLYDFRREDNKAGGSRETLDSKIPPVDSTAIYEIPWDVGLPPVEADDEPGCNEEPLAVRVTRPEASGLSVRIRSESMEVTLPLPDDGLLVGRGSVCDVILHSRAVSRHHVRVVPHGRSAVVEDCGSTNRARLRGQEVENSMTMEVGDVLNVCGTLFFLVSGKAG